MTLVKWFFVAIRFASRNYLNNSFSFCPTFHNNRNNLDIQLKWITLYIFKHYLCPCRLYVSLLVLRLMESVSLIHCFKERKCKPTSMSFPSWRWRNNWLGFIRQHGMTIQSPRTFQRKWGIDRFTESKWDRATENKPRLTCLQRSIVENDKIHARRRKANAFHWQWENYRKFDDPLSYV